VERTASIIHQCIEKDLERRYRSAYDLAVDLKKIDDKMQS
jgi:hypothetical protein